MASKYYIKDKEVDFNEFLVTLNTGDYECQVEEDEDIERLVYIGTKEIADLKNKLNETDYLAIKHSEGLISDEDYAPVLSLRQSYRNRINTLQQTP